MTFTVFDGVFLGVILAGFIWGAWKGLTWQLASVASLVLGYLVAYPAAGKLAPSFPGNASVSWLLALATSYVLVSGGIFLAAWLVRLALRKAKFEAYDRHLGGIVGAVGGMALAIVGTVLTISLAPNTRQPVLTSTSGKAINRILDTVHDALPESIHKATYPFWKAAHDEGLVEAEPGEFAEEPATAEEDETPRLARRDREPKAEEGDDDADNLIGDLLEEGGKRIGRAMTKAVESRAREATGGAEAGGGRDERDPRRRR
ncbi:MAG: CvpA family protein [Isosphaeraceae bacterium]